MDKTIELGGRGDVVCHISRLPKTRRRTIHEKYGLWICGAIRNGIAPPTDIHPRRCEYYCVSHIIEGRGFYWTPEDGRVPIRSGQGVIETPGHIHSYGGDHDGYVEDWLTFAGPVADHLYKAGIIRCGVVDIGRARRLEPIIELALNPAEYAQVAANARLQRLLVELYEHDHRTRIAGASPGVAGFLREIAANPGMRWIVSEMAASCGMSEVNFRRVFRKLTGLSPKQYVDRVRISQAEEMLRNTALSVAEVAGRHGYEDPFHFSRRFKELTGLAPARYRSQTARPGGP